MIKNFIIVGLVATLVGGFFHYQWKLINARTIIMVQNSSASQKHYKTVCETSKVKSELCDFAKGDGYSFLQYYKKHLKEMPYNMGSGI